MFLSKILIRSCIIILYIAAESIFDYYFSEQKQYQSVILKTALKLRANRRL